MAFRPPVIFRRKTRRRLPDRSRLWINLCSFLYREKGISPYSRAIKEARIIWNKMDKNTNKIESWLKLQKSKM